MSSRYVTNAVLALFGGFVVVASRTWHPKVVGWIGFAFGIGVIVITLLAQLDRARGVIQRVMDAGMLVLGGLTMAFGVGASGSAQRWTVFAFALGWVGMSFAGLTLHEIAQWRSRHQLGQLHWFPTLGRETASERPDRGMERIVG